MRERTLAMSRCSVIVFAALVGAGCATNPTPIIERDKEPLLVIAGDKEPLLALIERERFVDLPDTRTNTLTAAQKNEYDNGRRVVSHIRPRCAGPLDEKDQCRRTVDVLITAVEGAKYVKSSEPPKRPQLIAWIENLGRETTSAGLLPGWQARYALVVNSDKSKTNQGRPQLVLVQIDNPEKSSIGPFSTRQWEYGHVFECHKYQRPFLSDVDFRPCDLAKRSVVPQSSLWRGQVLATSLLTFAAQTYLDDPTWLSCTSGCCTSATPSYQ